MALKPGLQNNHLRACQYHTFLGLVPRDQVSVVGEGPRDLFLCCCLLGFLKLYFIYFWLCWVFVGAWAFLHSRFPGFSLPWLLLLWITGSRQAGSVVAQRHVEFSWTGDRSCVPCIGRRSLTHWTTRETQGSVFLHKPRQIWRPHFEGHS